MNIRNPPAHEDLACVAERINFRDGAKAVTDATKACELTDWTDPEALDTLAAQEAIEAIEAAAQRPPFPVARQVHVLGGRQVPFADGDGGPAERREHLGEEAVGERHAAIGAGKTCRVIGS